MLRMYINKAALLLTALLIYSCATIDGEKQKKPLDFSKLKEEMNYIDTNMIKEKAVDHVITGSKLEQQEKYAAAVIEFQQALRYDSTSSILYALAKNYKNMDKLNLAAEAALASNEKEPDFVPALELLGEIFIRRNNVDRAIETFKKINEIAPDKESKMKLARIYEFRNAEKAIEIYEELAEETEDYKLLMRLARLYRQTNQDEKFLETNEKIFKYRPNASSALSILDNYLKENKYEHALNFLNKLDRTLSPDQLPTCYGTVGSALYEDTSSTVVPYAERFLEMAGGRFKFDWRLQMLTGYLYDKTGDTSKRDLYLDRVLTISDSAADVPLQIGIFYMDKQDYMKATEIFRKFEDKFPDDHRFPLFQGIALVSADSLKKALEPLNRALKIDSSNADIWAQLGIVYDRLGISDSSDMAYKKALSLDPYNPLVSNNYAYSMAVRGQNLEKALEMSKIALNAEPNNSAYLDTYGWIQYRLENYEEALEYTQKAIDTGDASAEVYEHLGDIYIKLDKKQKAVEAWQKALDLEPGRNTVIEKLNKHE